VELAVLLPFLSFVFVAAVDFGRVFYSDVAVTNCAGSGALYASTDASHAANTQGIQNDAEAEAPELSSQLRVSSTTATDNAGNPVVAVKVTYPFHNSPGISECGGRQPDRAAACAPSMRPNFSLQHAE
jgi:Flp pilus assembly protein TadG